MEEIKIDTDYITLGKFLKLVNAIDSGGQAKIFLAEYEVYINDEQDNRRGRKLYSDDRIQIEDIGKYLIKKT